MGPLSEIWIKKVPDIRFHAELESVLVSVHTDLVQLIVF